MKLYHGTLRTEGVTTEQIREEMNCDNEAAGIIMDYMRAWEGIRGVFVENSFGEGYSLIGWPPEEDTKAKEAIYLMEQDSVFGNYQDDREGFDKAWAEGSWEPAGAITFKADQIENLEDGAWKE